MSEQVGQPADSADAAGPAGPVGPAGAADRSRRPGRPGRLRVPGGRDRLRVPGRRGRWGRRLNDDLGVPPMRDLVRAADLELLGLKAEQNTSNPSNPRPASAADYTAMFAAEITR